MAIVKILLHTRVNDDFGKRIPVINFQNCRKLLGLFQSQPRFHRNFSVKALANRFQKAVERVHVRQHARALALDHDRARRTAKIEINFPISLLPKHRKCPKRMFCMIGQQLRHHAQSGIVRGQYIIFFACGQFIGLIGR